MFEVAIGYVVGTVVGLFLFRMAIRERIVSATLDMLIQEEYVRAYDDEDGVTQLYKWQEAVDEDVWRRLADGMEEMKENGRFEEILNEILEEEQEENDEDDTP